MARLPAFLLLLISFGGMIYFGRLSLSTADDVRAFAADTSCTAPFQEVRATATSLCRLQPATVVPGSFYVGGNRSPEYYVSLDLGDGRVDRVAIASYSGEYLYALRSRQGVAATAHLFRNRVDAFETSSIGIVTTRNRPTETQSRTAAVESGLLGVFGAFAGLLTTLSWRLRVASARGVE
ncbi:MAG: hypothetical protein ACLPYS_12615 [Vulcanimicrobiaceae bacterium]